MVSAEYNIKIIIKGDARFYGSISADKAGRPFLPEDQLLGEIAKQKPEITYNNNRTYPNGKKAPDGIELRFGVARPIEEVRQMLRDHGYRFSEKQTLWYAIENAKSRELVEYLAANEVDVDTTQYEKRSFWVKVKNRGDYGRLRDRTEFWVKKEPPKYFYSKSYLEKAVALNEVISDGLLYFKKYYNKVVGEEDPEGDEAGSEVEDNSSDIADELQALADGLQKEIDSKINSATSRLRPTARRLRIAEGMREQGYRLMEVQRVLYALALAHRSGEIDKFPFLKNIRSKTGVQLLNDYTMASLQPQTEDAWQDLFRKNRVLLERMGIETLEAWKEAEFQKSTLLSRYRPSMTQQNRSENYMRIKELEGQAFRENIPGFFPTPRPLIDRMLELAELQLYHTILDPSAGKGDILDAVAEKFPGKNPALYATEVNSTLRDILHLKGYTLWGTDFLDVKDTFDRILMNPPFEKGQDADHVTHAFSLLRFGGRLVAIVSEGLFFRQTKKERAFRELLRANNAYISEPIKEAFKNGFNTTSVSVRLIALNVDGNPFDLPSAPWQRSDTDSPEGGGDIDAEHLLELEAEAELELLRMRVENERRKRARGISGITIDAGKLQRLRQKAWTINNGGISDFN